MCGVDILARVEEQFADELVDIRDQRADLLPLSGAADVVEALGQDVELIAYGWEDGAFGVREGVDLPEVVVQFPAGLNGLGGCTLARRAV